LGRLTFSFGGATKGLSFEEEQLRTNKKINKI
jgi:hypothetical protein